MLLKVLADERAYIARIAELEAALAEAQTNYTAVGNKLAAATGRDLPDLDGTDAAHPAWWRGQDYGAASICRALTEVLDGKQPSGKCAEPFETLRRRVWEAREDSARLEWASANPSRWGKRTDWTGTGTGEWWAIDGPGPGTHPTLRAAIDAARGNP
jgi:hypothetical protein